MGNACLKESYSKKDCAISRRRLLSNPLVVNDQRGTTCVPHGRLDASQPPLLPGLRVWLSCPLAWTSQAEKRRNKIGGIKERRSDGGVRYGRRVLLWRFSPMCVAIDFIVGQALCVSKR